MSTRARKITALDDVTRMDLFFFFVNINEKKNHYKRRISKRMKINVPALRWS